MIPLVSIGNNQKSLSGEMVEREIADCTWESPIMRSSARTIGVSLWKVPNPKVRRSGVPVWNECTSVWASIHPLKNVSSQK